MSQAPARQVIRADVITAKLHKATQAYSERGGLKIVSSKMSFDIAIWAPASCAECKGCTLDTSLKSRMPLGEDESKVRRCVLLSANSDMNFSIAVVTSGESAHASRQARSVGKCAGYSQSKSRPARGPSLSYYAHPWFPASESLSCALQMPRLRALAHHPASCCSARVSAPWCGCAHTGHSIRIMPCVVSQ